MKQKYDESKYEVSEDMPSKFAQVIPGMGVQHFSKKHLSDNDIKALLKAGNRYVKDKSQPEDQQYQEDQPKAAAKQKGGKQKETPPEGAEFKDIDAGKFPQ